MKRAPYSCVREDGKPKKAYKSREIAEMHAKQLERRVLYVVNVYQCAQHGYHIGSRLGSLNEVVRRTSPAFN